MRLCMYTYDFREPGTSFLAQRQRIHSKLALLRFDAQFYHEFTGHSKEITIINSGVNYPTSKEEENC